MTPAINENRQNRPPLADGNERDRIVSALDRNMLVEAAAGTGKTSGMIARMLALLRTGACPHVRNMAAITFTRKAAAEIRSRFQVALEQAWRETEGEEKKRLERVLAGIEQCFIGTIHSFCARLLRERPLEAGVGISFREIDDLKDARLRDEAWEEFTTRLLVHDPENLLGRLREKGMRLSDLKSAFLSYADFPDVEEWPLPQPGPEENAYEDARRELEKYVSHLSELAPRLPRDPGNDKLIPELRRLPRIVSHYCFENPCELMEVLEYFDKNPGIVQRVWEKGNGLSGETAKEEKARWDRFREKVVKPTLCRWRESRYSLSMEVLNAARSHYDSLRRERGLLNFQDLLVETVRLLRDHPEVRKDLQARFTHILVDEFQDTDPVQAEMIFLLAASDHRERDWRRCVPRPGSLFLVGDPKQSIYRFRRADISIYNEVKELLQRSGGLILNLNTNFRSTPELVEWINAVFSPGPDPDPSREGTDGFPHRATEFSPAYVELVPSPQKSAGEGFRGIYRLTVPAEYSRNEDALPFMADRIARFIRDACSGNLTLHRTPREKASGRGGKADPSDFMILTYRKDDLGIFAEKLQEYGIPHRVSGGESLNRVPELRLLHICLKAALQPEDPVSLVAVLRSELFGLSDAELYAYKKSGGVFSYRSPVPPDLSDDQRKAFRDAFQRLEKYRLWIYQMPPVAAIERMASDLGLTVSAASRPGGEIQAGSLAKALEILREAQNEMWTSSQLLEYLERLAENEESYDGISALSEDLPAVRVMNLHKAKGLEAPVVFLAGVRGGGGHDIEKHVDRSSGRVRGYLAVYRVFSRNAKKLLAHPANWETLSERERAFLDAESLRLRYVAATRASTACVIAQKAKNNHNHPWRHFADFLKNAPELPELQVSSVSGKPAFTFDLREAENATRILASRKETAVRPTYGILAAKKLALSSAETGTAAGAGVDKEWSLEEIPNPRAAGPPIVLLSIPVETAPPSPHVPEAAGVGPEGDDAAETMLPVSDIHGPEFGEVIHLLLRAAMENPGAPLELIASSQLEEKGLDPGLAQTAAELARKVMSSGLWERARAGGKYLVEAPFHFLDGESFRVPTVVRGVIDLAFREEDGWVLVDYKTDRTAGRDPLRIAQRYVPQLRLYAEIWEKITEERVKESLIYLVEADRLYRLVRAG